MRHNSERLLTWKMPKMKNKLIWIIVVLLVIGGTMFFFNKKSYQVISDDYFENNKEKYREGQKVELKIPVATDTDYSFDCDVEYDLEYKDYYYVLSFIMPNRDVHVSYSTKNTMAMKSILSYSEYHLNDRDLCYEIYNDGPNMLSIIDKDGNIYHVYRRILEDVEFIIELYKADTWSTINDPVFIDGKSYFFVYDNDKYVSVSSGKMSEDGLAFFAEIKRIIEAAISVSE